MAPRLLLQMVLATLLAISVAGCTNAPSGGTGAPGGDDADAPDDDGASGPLTGLVPGVEELPVPVGSPGGVEGVVYDLGNGMILEEVAVTATCFRQALPVGANESRALPVDEKGAFAMAATGAFSDCTKVTYTIEAPGYTIQVPLETGPLIPGVLYRVHAGMTPLS